MLWYTGWWLNFNCYPFLVKYTITDSSRVWENGEQILLSVNYFKLLKSLLSGGYKACIEAAYQIQWDRCDSITTVIFSCENQIFFIFAD